MAIKLKGDIELKTAPTVMQKALKINLNQNIYGTFSEIGAGQETVRNFFRAGASAATIAKAMSAYAKEFSDAIYGRENDGRYVTKTRLLKMLKHETDLMESRLERTKTPDRIYFSFANTVSTIDFAKTNKGHGWVGIRFQLNPLEEYSQIILHIRFHENDSKYQQITLGKLGVNLTYGAFYHHDDPKELLLSLYDHIDKDKIEVDMINFSGPRFAFVDNRLMSLLLVKNGFTDAVMFGPDGYNILPADELYKKNILALRGSFRPVTKLAIDMLEKAKQKFLSEPDVSDEKKEIIFEMTLDNLSTEGDINERDFLDRVNLLSSINQYVMVSNFKEYYRLVEYFSRFTKEKMGLIIGANHLVKLFDPAYYQNLSGGIMEAMGKMFEKNLKLYIYPYMEKDSDKVMCAKNIDLPKKQKILFDYINEDKRFEDIDNFDKNLLRTYNRELIKQIQKGQKKWEAFVPEEIVELITKQKLFGYNKIIE